MVTHLVTDDPGLIGIRNAEATLTKIASAIGGSGHLIYSTPVHNPESGENSLLICRYDNYEENPDACRQATATASIPADKANPYMVPVAKLEATLRTVFLAAPPLFDSIDLVEAVLEEKQASGEDNQKDE